MRLGRGFPPSSVLRQAEIPLGNTYVGYTTPGLWTYQIPSWVQPGHLIDMVGIGGGVGGIIYAGSTAVGGGPGAWNAQTFTYGTDIPNGTTTLYVRVGSGGSPSSSGISSLVGYGLGSTPTFDAVGTYHSAAATSSLSFSHTATAGAAVCLAFTVTTGTLGAVTYGGAAVSGGTTGPAGISGSLGAIYLFLNVAGGTQTAVINGTSITVGAIPVSYNNVGGFAKKGWTSGSGTALSQPLLTGPNTLTVQSFGGGSAADTFSAFSGGTNRANGSNAGANSVSISDTTSAVDTFAATGSTSNPWSGTALNVTPSLSTTLITFAGGGGANTVNAGQAAANETFPASGLASKTFIGGATQSTDGLQGNSPGGGGPGGTASVLPGMGGDGAVYITARRS